MSPTDFRPDGFFASRNLSPGLQLFTLGQDALRDLEPTLRRVAAIGYRSVELPGVKAGAGRGIRAAAAAAGLTVTGVHVQAGPTLGGMNLTLVDAPGRIAEELHALDCSDVILPFPVVPPPPAVPAERMAETVCRMFAEGGADLWKRTAALLNERSEALRREGLSLGYHNHNLEFLPVGDTRGWEILMAELDPSVTLEVDAGWVAAAGIDLASFFDGLRGRVRQLHVKDIQRARPGTALQTECTEIGSGIVDWNRVLPAAYRAGARHYVVEQEAPFSIDRFDAIQKSLDYLCQA